MCAGQRNSALISAPAATLMDHYVLCIGGEAAEITDTVWSPCSRCVQKMPAKIVPVKKVKIVSASAKLLPRS